MNIIGVARKENVGKKYESNNEFKEIWTLKKEANDIFELYNENGIGITDLYYVSEIASLEFKEIIDWSEIPVDTKMLVSDDGKIWFKRYFAKYENGEIYCFLNGASSFSVDDEADIIMWEYVKLYEE